MDEGYTNTEMSRDIMAHIVMNALAPAPAGETPLEQRIRILQETLAAQNERMRVQRAALEQLRQEMDDYAALVEKARAKSVQADSVAAEISTPIPAPLRAPAPSAMMVPISAPLRLVATRLESVERPLMPRAAYAAARMLPYAAMAAVVVVVSLIVSQRTARATLSRELLPSPRLEAAVAAPSEEELNAEVLSLVYDYVAPGSRRSVQDVLRPELDTAHDSPWTIVRVDDRTVLVSFRPYGETLETAPVYEFEVDPVSKAVKASRETISNLRGNLLAQR